jgi:hypothetical protein
MKSRPCLSKASLGCASKADAANVQNLLAVLIFCSFLYQDKREVLMGWQGIKGQNLVQTSFELLVVTPADKCKKASQ